VDGSEGAERNITVMDMVVAGYGGQGFVFIASQGSILREVY
jgi:hypothetical protein